jgi:hypothetical protein
MHKVKNVFRYTLSSFSLVVAILTLINGGAFPSLLLAAGSIFLLPPVSIVVATKIPNINERIIRRYFPAFLIVMGLCSLPTTGKNHSSDEKLVGTKPLERVDSVDLKARRNTNYYNNTVSSAEAIKKELPSESGDAEEYSTKIFLLKARWEEAKLAKATGVDSIVRAGKMLETALKAHQKLALPQMRKAYVKKFANTLWEHNIEVIYSKKEITFVGGRYANNGNIKNDYEVIAKMLQDLRFSKANYKWYKYDDEYTYYDIKAGQDEDPYEM